VVRSMDDGDVGSAHLDFSGPPGVEEVSDKRQSSGPIYETSADVIHFSDEPRARNLVQISVFHYIMANRQGTTQAVAR
jgi:hypothetical protein